MHAARLTAVPAEPIPIIGYIRVSLAREEMISPEIQKSVITTWAQRTNRRVVDWVYDLDKSGRNFRRKVMRTIERIEAREAAEIGVYRYDRWGRNAVESLANCKRVEIVGGQVQSATEPFDVETAIGKYSRTNAFAIAEMQSDLISENWRAALANRVERGIPSAGTPRFGYVRLGRIRDPYSTDAIRQYRRDPQDEQGERYEPDYANGTADAHIQMFDIYIGGGGFPQVSQWLNARGILNTRGGPWSDITARNVMDSGFAAGLLRIHHPECRCGKASSCTKRIYVPGAHPAILDEGVWPEYLDVRAARTKMAPRARRAEYPVTGCIFCGHCNSTMKIQNGGKPNRPGYSYRCSRWEHYRDCPAAFPQRLQVEAEVRAELATWGSDIDARAANTTARKVARMTAQTDVARLEAALDEADGALRRLMKQRVLDEDKMPDGIYDGLRDELLAARAETEKELAKVKASATLLTEDPAPLAASLVDDWDTLPVQSRRDTLTKLIRHVKVYRLTDTERAEQEGDRLWRVEVTPLWEDCDCPLCQTSDAEAV